MQTEERRAESVQKGRKKYLQTGQMILSAIVIGIVVGAVDMIFGKGLLEISAFRQQHIKVLVPFFAVAGIVIVWSYEKYGRESKRGMGLIFAVACEEEEEIPLRLVPFVLLGTWITHLFGGSAGREGVAVQIGATLAHHFGKGQRMEHAGRIYALTGMAAGFSGLFQTPIAAIFFALEVTVVGRMEWMALLPATIASIVSCSVSHALGLEKFQVHLEKYIELDPVNIGKLAILGLIFGIAGGGFAWSLKKAKKKMADLWKEPIKRVAIMGICLSVILLVFHQGRYCGLGTNLIEASVSGGDIYAYDWIMKLILTVLTLAAGYQGGEVTPLFSIGASLGAVCAGIAGLPIELAAALGYAAVFASATNTFMAPLWIGIEVFGSEHTLEFAIVCLVAYLANGRQSIYAQR